MRKKLNYQLQLLRLKSKYQLQTFESKLKPGKNGRAGGRCMFHKRKNLSSFVLKKKIFQ